ncbi:hypothetical protein FH972_003077 [Carpinus fangiana]|uniref:cytokinin dehydrogenase n=1 Tax=Carpinus fangiana TaxID=176857 RepID=A0A5N6QKA6_9ROSI|nr:hypothetical protein FH972_003077 [Carpinus fangiana]
MGVSLPPKPNDIADRFCNDSETIKLASTDYGHIVQEIPAAVFHPTSVNDTAILINFAYNNNTTVPITIAARGRGHSVRGQAMARGGVVVNMTSLENRINGSGISVSRSPFLGFFADVGGEQLWIDVLHATLEHGLSPVSWTDYLYLTVGGTLSNAGISGQTFRFGPQISNVYELDVITGKGDIVTCSTKENSELYYAVLGGLGQFGIITRARIALKPAPTRVKWLRMLYNDFSAFSRDQEHLISINGRKQGNAFDYLEGMLLLNQAPPDVSFFPEPDQPRIISLVTQHGIIYCIEAAIYYDDRTVNTVDKELQVLVKGLSFLPGFIFEKNVSYVDFVNRVGSEEQILRSKGLWDIPHPWLNLFVPRSRISDFDSGVFKNIILKQNISAGLVLLYPMNRNKWDDNMSAVIPEEDVFYAVSLLRSSGFNTWEAFDRQNEEILQFCENVGIKVQTYLSHYETQESWIKHFGSKWRSFQERKAQFDPKMILAPGQRIFNK